MQAVWGFLLGLLRVLFVPGAQSNLWRWAMVAVAIGIAFRIAVFAYAIYSPIQNEKGDPVSPMEFQRGADYDFYLKSKHLYFNNFENVLQEIKGLLDFQAISEEFSKKDAMMYKFVLAGPVLPFLFSILHYGEYNTLMLSLFSLIVGLLTNVLWINFFYRQGIPPAWMIVFALLPNAVWYQLNNSADHFIFFFFTLFFVIYYSNWQSGWRIALSLVFVLLMCLTKPNAMPVMGFLLLVMVRERWGRPWGLGMRLFVFAVVVLAIAGAVFYAAYFAAVLRVTMAYSFFGVPHELYLSGLYGSLPEVLDKPLSWISLFFAKLLYFVGLRPSWGSTDDLLVLLRAAPGLLLLPGLIWLLVKGNRSMALLVFLYMVPPFIGPAQERFNLPIHPILFMYGAIAYTAGFVALRQRLVGSKARPPRATAAAE